MSETIQKILNSHLCSGCGTCNVLCPANAICMKFDNIGRLQAQIIDNKCFNCGLCFKACPSYDYQGVVGSYLKKDIIGNIKSVCTGRAADNDIFENGQSGGVVTAILSYLFCSKIIDAAIVCVVEYGKVYTSKPVIITDPSDLLKSQKSSYTPIDVVSALKQASLYKSVAIVGTGCHIQGVRTLQAINNEKFSNIKLLIGLICDRVLCTSATEIIAGSHFKGQNKKIIWRDKRENYKKPKVIIQTEDGNECEVPSWKRHMLKSYLTPPRCLICHDKLNLGADIVLGDPWGMSNIDWEKGASVAISRTDIGEDIIKKLIQEKILYLKKASLNELLKGQDINGKLERIRDYYNAFYHFRWELPSYRDKILTHSSNESEVAKKQLQQFKEDLSHNRVDIIRRYKKKLLINSLKIRIKRLIH